MQPVSLCIDFGNTNLKATIFHGDRLSQKFIFSESDAINTLQKIIAIHNPQKAILSSVINHSKSIDNFLQENTKLIVLNSSTKLPFLNAYGTPETLGNDRLALVAALSKQFPAQDSLVVSIGTCVTYSLLAKNNAFRGGAISPGVELRLRSLHEFTDKLPLVSREGHISILGYDTETAIRSGVINGMVAEIEGMIQFYEGQYGKINAVLTGGDAPFFESRMKKKIFADTNFLFKGLYAILEQQK
ncbi:MAG: type III pantothenate kinase [Bacteroidetes bacterium]|nr:type III pantothenate kinase [Bacteroidota bacterium]MBP6316068.1 type III pantothenate kinase [Chitinophagaceae bacterium]